MTQKIYLDGTDQYVLTRLGSVNNTTGVQNIIAGTSGGDLLTSIISGVVISWHEYKKESIAIDADIIWDSSIGIWKVPIPFGYITVADNTAWVSVTGANSDNTISIIPTLIEVDVCSSQNIINALTTFGVAKTSELATILDEVIDPSHHNTPKSLARLLYILYCGEIGSILNTRASRTILNENGQVIVSNTITTSNTSVTRSGGYE